MNFDEYINTIWEEDLLEFAHAGKIQGAVYEKIYTQNECKRALKKHCMQMRSAKAVLIVLDEKFDDKNQEILMFLMDFLENVDEYKIVYKNIQKLIIITFGLEAANLL